MPELPHDWKRLNVHDYRRELGVSNLRDYPPELVIKRQSNSSYIYASWLPPVEIDDRIIPKGKKRREHSSTTNEIDPKKSARIAIEWVKRKKEELLSKLEDSNNGKQASLHHFWEILKAEIIHNLKQKRNSDRRISDEISKFEGKAYGIGNQPWSLKRIDKITYQDIFDYWTLLDERKTDANDMSETKRQQRALLNKIYETARRNGFPSLPNPIYPTIVKSISKKIPGYFRREEWDALLRAVNTLSDGFAQKEISRNTYESIPVINLKPNQSPKYFVDLFDALCMMWFWYLRAEDLPRLRAEYFFMDKRNPEDQKVALAMEELKGYRDAYPTSNFRPDAWSFANRMLKRRPSGYLVAPHKPRTKRNENESQVKKFLNDRLKYALKFADLPLQDEYGNRFTMHNIRHTALMLTFLEYPRLRADSKELKDFAKNAHTDDERLRETYLNHIEREEIGRDARQTLKPSPYTLVRRVGKE